MGQSAQDKPSYDDVEALLVEQENLSRFVTTRHRADLERACAEDVPRLIAIVREQRDRLARAESAELALLDLRRVMQSDFDPSNELGAKLLVQSVVEKLDRLAKLEAGLSEALDRWQETSQYKGEYLAAKHGDAEDIAELRELLEAKDTTP